MRWSRFLLSPRFRAAAWLLGWVAIVAVAPFVPLGVAIALAVALFAAQILAGALAPACHLPPGRAPDAAPDVTKHTHPG